MTHLRISLLRAALFAASLSGSYGELRHQLMTQYPDWVAAARSPEFAKSLNRAWPLVGEASAAYLRTHPAATAKDLAAAVQQLNGAKCSQKDEPCRSYTLTADAVPLGNGTFVVLASYPQSAAFFVVSKSGVLWNIKDVAARHYAKRDEIGYWAWIEFPFGDGPMIGRIGSLPPTRSGHPRFYVDGQGAALAGGTYRQQISVWEWEGRTAVPEIIQSYWVSVQTDPNELRNGEFRIPIKGTYKTFYSCGQCAEPRVVWTLQVTPDGVRDLGKKHVVPELQQLDELFDRVLHGRSTRELASPRVAAALRKNFAGVHDRLGMLGSWSVKGTVFDFQFDSDDVRCGNLRFTVEKRPNGLYFSDVACR